MNEKNRRKPKMTPHQQREAIRRRDVDGETFADIARTLQCQPQYDFEADTVNPILALARKPQQMSKARVFAMALVAGQLTIDRTEPGLQKLVERHTGQSKLKQAVEWFGELLFGGLPSDVVASIEREATDKHKSTIQPLEAAVLLLLTRPEAQLG